MKHFLKISCLFVILAFFTFQCKSSKKFENEFTISGKVQGSSTKQLILYYKDSKNNEVTDTIPVNNGAFKTKGNLNNPQKVTLVGNVKEKSFDNPNIARFYLGYDDVDMVLIEDQFNKTKVRGSSIQNEYINLFAKLKPIYKMIDPIMAERQKLVKLKNPTMLDSTIDNQLETLSLKQFKLIDSIQTIELNYAWNNPNSYLSVDLISFYMSEISKDSLLVYYNNFTPNIKTSFQAETIKDFLNLKVAESSIGDKAPDFESKDLSGNVISLNQFKGNYVLLDFWAGWCLPCKKNHPELKRLYKTYYPKGLEIIGVSSDMDEKSWRDNIKKEDTEWHHVFDGTRNIKKDGISLKYDIQTIPAYILIDKEGRIIGRYLNTDGKNNSLIDLEIKLKELLK